MLSSIGSSCNVSPAPIRDSGRLSAESACKFRKVRFPEMLLRSGAEKLLREVESVTSRALPMLVTPRSEILVDVFVETIIRPLR